MTSQLCDVDWYQFEKVVGQVYEGQGYTLERRGGANPDGGIDLLIERDGERSAVQCKHWKKWKVKSSLVRVVGQFEVFACARMSAGSRLSP